MEDWQASTDGLEGTSLEGWMVFRGRGGREEEYGKYENLVVMCSRKMDQSQSALWEIMELFEIIENSSAYFFFRMKT